MDARKKNVLLAVVEAYIQTGEPVGSKMISQLPQIHVSAATVRNDMAVLEELGYLEQPHTSAGRVPTYSGYRFYIDEVVEQGSLSDAERKRLDAMLGDESQLTEDLLIQSATTALSEVTKCATVVSDFAPKYSVISKVEVIPTGKRLYVVLLITSNGTIKITPYEYYPATLRSCFFPSYRLLHRYFPCQIPNPQQNICLSVALTKSQYL